jgi:hypothetical protein
VVVHPELFQVLRLTGNTILAQVVLVEPADRALLGS